MESQSTKLNQIKPNHNNNHFNYRVNKSGHYVERRTKTTYVISISAIFTRQADGFDCGRSNGTDSLILSLTNISVTQSRSLHTSRTNCTTLSRFLDGGDKFSLIN